jgi:hypothetical protein
LDDLCSCLPPLGVVDWRSDVRRTTSQRAMGPVVQDVVR